MSGENGSNARLDAILTRAALTRPQRAAVIFQDITWTYAEVHGRACRLAGALAALGVQKGDRVALWAGNRAEFVEVLFGVPMLGALASPLDHWWTWKDAQNALVQIRPRVLIVGAPQATYLQGHDDALRAAGIEHVLHLDDDYPSRLAAATPLTTPTPVSAHDPAVVFFTSGSTGRSKGAVHTHASLTAAAVTMNAELEIPDGERTLHFLPLFSSCMEHLIPLTLARGTHIVQSQFDASGVWEAVLKYGVTHFDAVPTTLRRILEVAPATIPATLRSISYASERMPPQLITALVERMPTVEFVQFYGMMEQLCLTVCGPKDQLRKIDTVGRRMRGAELHLRNVEGQVAGPGEDGEIYARSPSLFAGYWQDEAATASVMQGARFRGKERAHDRRARRITDEEPPSARLGRRDGEAHEARSHRVVRRLRGREAPPHGPSGRREGHRASQPGQAPRLLPAPIGSRGRRAGRAPDVRLHPGQDGCRAEQQSHAARGSEASSRT